MRSLSLSALLVVGLLCPGLAFAEGEDNVYAKELRGVREQIQAEEQHLDALRKRNDEIKGSLERLSQEEKELEGQKTGLESVLAEINDRLAKLQEAVRKGRDKVRSQRQALNVRLVAIYKMQRRAGPFMVFGNARSAVDLLRRSHYMTRVAEADHRRLVDLNTVVEGFNQERQELIHLRERRGDRLREIQSIEKGMAEKRVQQGGLLEELKRESERRESSLGKLRESSARLENLLTNLMGGAPDVAQHEPVGKRVEEEKRIALPFSGAGLEAKKGALKLPVAGTLLRGFGKQRHDEYADVVFLKGMEFQCKPATKVVTVASGKVVFSQMLPGFGRLIILDHGKRYYTLYGLLAGTVVREGDILQEGDVVGVAGEPDKSGRNFYFELRIGGKPVDPAAFFKEVPHAVE